MLFSAGAAQAQTSVTLVSNTGQDTDSTSRHGIDRAQQFTTGSNAAGYTLTSVTFPISGIIRTSFTRVQIARSKSNGQPGDSLGTLKLSSVTGTATGTTDGIDLTANTKYFVVLISTDGNTNNGYQRTNSNNENTAETGWSIADGSRFYSGSNQVPTWGSTSTSSWKIAIHGAVKTSNSAPTVANQIPNQDATAGTAFSYQFPADTFNDADTGTTLVYTAKKSDDSALPSWLSFNASTRTFSGTPQAADIGTVSVKVTASDGTDSASDTFDIVVSAAPAPTARAGADRSVNPGAAVTLDGSASVAPPGATMLGYAWSQTAGPTVTLRNADTAQAAFTAPVTAGALTFQLTVTATGGPSNGLSATDDVTLTVGDAPPRFAAGVRALRLEPGAAMTPVVLPAAGGGNGGPYSYALASEPAGLAGLSFDAATREISGTAAEEQGRWTFTYTAHDGDANTADSDAARLTFTVTVSKVSPERRRAVKRTLAAVASRTVTSALGNIGARLGDGVPGASLTLAGESVPMAASGASGPSSGTAAGWRDGPHGPDSGACPPAGFGNGAEDCPRAWSRGVDAGAVLPTSAFSLTLGAAAGDKGGDKEGAPGFDPEALRWSVWGRGDYGAFAGRPERGMRYKGETRTGWLGVDARGSIRGSTSGSGSSGRWVAGLAVSHGTSEADYSFDGGDDPSERGRIETALTALWPYGRWTFADGLELRGMLGAGRGRLRHEPGGGEPAETGRLKMWAVSLGLKQTLPPLAGIDLAARGDASFARIASDGGGETLDGLRADIWRGRVGLEGSRRFALEEGASLTPFLEAAARQDGGDGLTGTGLELAGGLRYAAPGVAVELRGRWLALHTQEDTKERGVSVTVRMQPEPDGRGLSLSLSPRWGAGTGGADALWREEMPKGAPAGSAGGADPAGRLEGELGYGLPLFGERFTGTPNLGFGLSDRGARDYRIGWRLTSALDGDPGFRVDLDATRQEADGDDRPAEHGAMLRGTIRW